MIARLADLGETAYQVGEIIARDGDEPLVEVAA